MKRRWIATLSLGLAGIGLAGYALLAQAALQPGATAPEFTVQATLGGKAYQYVLHDALAHGPVVLYFYPAAFTTGCTIEAHDFAEAMPQYQALGATVLGVSHDDLDTLKRFSVSECRSKFPVGADTDAHIIQAYDAAFSFKRDMANRISYVITPDGKVLYSYSSLSPDQHVANTLQALRAWRASHPLH